MSINAQEQKKLDAIKKRIDRAKLRGETPELSAADETFLDQIALKRSRQAIRKKALGGKPLTAREERILSEGSGNYAKDLTAAAKILGRSRQCLTRWRKKYPDAPEPRADGRVSIAEWREFMLRHDLADAADPGDGEDEDSKAFWDRRRARLEFERSLYAFEIEKQKHIAIDDITAAVGQMLAGFRVALNTLPAGAARWLMGLKDFHQIKDKLQSEVDAVLRALGRCHYLEEVTPAVIAKLFPDYDQSARAELIQACSATFQELGRLALSDLLQRELPDQDPQAESQSADQDHANSASDTESDFSPKDAPSEPTVPTPVALPIGKRLAFKQPSAHKKNAK